MNFKFKVLLSQFKTDLFSLLLTNLEDNAGFLYFKIIFNVKIKKILLILEHTGVQL